MKPLLPSQRSLRKLNFFAAFFLCLSSSFLALHELNYPLVGIDDANIYFVYARNLANGYGFVYNIGGERVEGFTSLLWTVISALAFKFSIYPELTLLIINIVIVSLGITCALNYLQHAIAREGKNRKTEFFWSGLFLILLFSSPRYIVWNTITLMENALWSTLLLLATIFVMQDHASFRRINLGFTLLSVLLFLTRPESILWVAVFAVVLLLRIAFHSNIINALRLLAPSFVSMILALALLTLFRLYYFGYPLPNTYYAKVSPSFTYNLVEGTIYLIRYFISDPIATISIISISLACIYSIVTRSLKRDSLFLLIITATGLLIPLLTGGDHFGSFRFYQNTYPITLLCFIYFANKVLSRISDGLNDRALFSGAYKFLFTGLVLLLTYGFVLSQISAWSHFSSEIEADFKVAEYERRNGAFIQQLFLSLPNLPSVGVIASGGIKYSYAGEIIDLLGLNNTIMAHNHGKRMGYKNHAAFEVETFHQLQPDIVWPINVNGSQWHYSEAELRERWENTLGFKGLFNDTRFLELYAYAKVSKNSESKNETALVAWFKKDFLKKLIPEKDFSVEQYPYAP